MRLSLIVAVSRDNVIGKDGGLPWDKIPEDMANFRRLTMGKPVIMGRKTFESLGKPLKWRRNIVLTRSPGSVDDNAHTVRSPVEAICEAYESLDNSEAFVIGGAEIYGLFFNLCTDAYVTTLGRDCDGDVRFPFNFKAKWDVAESRELAPGVLFRHLVKRVGRTS